eukprot:scaffold315348_cov21-Tisochrysis_lutea.AAC.1
MVDAIVIVPFMPIELHSPAVCMYRLAHSRAYGFMHKYDSLSDQIEYCCIVKALCAKTHGHAGFVHNVVRH